MHQSCIDLLACCFTIIEELLIENNISGRVTCQLLTSKSVSLIALYTSTYNMMVMAMEQQAAIVKPLEYDAEVVRKRLPFVFLVEWSFCTCALLFIPSTTEYINGTCIVTKGIMHTVFWDFVSLYLFIIAMGIPLIVIIICYTRMISALRGSSKAFGIQKSDLSTSVPQAVHKLRLAQVNIFQTCLIMVVVFLGCWSTVESAILMYVLGMYQNLGNNHYAIGKLLSVTNSCINPYIYAIRYDDFKKQIKILMRFSA